MCWAFAARKQVFIHPLRSDLPALEGRHEIDQLDDEHAIYLVVTHMASGLSRRPGCRQRQRRISLPISIRRSAVARFRAGRISTQSRGSASIAISKTSSARG